jgi:isoquinoline 1-oxidoreductase beta subunit
MNILLQKLNRRALLKAAGITALSGPIYSITACSENNTSKAQIDDIKLFINITEQHLAFILPRAEMGQDLVTSFSMIIAEETDLPLEQIQVQFADADSRFGNQMTVGSASIRNWWSRLRQIGASLRAISFDYASKKYTTTHDHLYVDDGFLFVRNSDTNIPLLTLFAETPLEGSVEARPKAMKDFKLVGQEIASTTAKDKITGNFKFLGDFRLTDLDADAQADSQTDTLTGTQTAPLLNAVTINYKKHWPKPSKTQQVQWQQQFKLKHVIALDQGFSGFDFRVVLLAESLWPLLKCKQEITQALNASLRDNNSPPPQPYDSEDKPSIFKSDASFLECSFYTPEIAHAPLETQTAIARHSPKNTLELWAPSQAPMRAKQRIAEMLDKDLNSITLHTTAMGGSFGRKRYDDFLLEAAFISQALFDRGSLNPIKLIWTREDDLSREHYRPSSYQTLRWSIDTPNTISHTLLESQGPNSPQNKSTHSFFPFLSWGIETQKTQLSGKHINGILRSVHHGYLAFSVCSFIDELSYIHKEDPINYFSKHLKSPGLVAQFKATIDPGTRYQDQRLKEVIQQVKTNSNWEQNSNQGSALGFAAYYCFKSYIAVVVKLSNHQNTLTVEHIWASVDCGTAVNPNGLRAQIEGGLIFGLSACLYGQLPEEQHMFDANFDRYQVARMNNTPTIDVSIQQNSFDPSGAGELAVPPIAPAIANAYRKLSGKRLLSMPFLKNETLNTASLALSQT